MNIETLKTVKARVEEILAAFPEARNDDKILLKVYYALFHDFHMPEEFFALGVPNPETVRRTRQAIQEKGGFPPTEEVIAMRRGRADAYQEFYSTKEAI